jgi:hypothetical protein
VKYGESISGAQFKFASQTLIPEPCIVSIRRALPNSLTMGEAEAAIVSIKSA